MVTASQLSRLNVKLDALVAAIDTDSQATTVVLFAGETRDFALQRHRELRPDHARRPVRFEHRNVPRTKVVEMFAVHTAGDLEAVLDRIEAAGGGLTAGQRMLRDAHGWDDENDRDNHRD